jgi:Tol biopolymer transport system component
LASGPLWRIAASGGKAVPFSKLDPPRQTGHRFPQFLPDGRHFIFYSLGNAEGSGIYLGSLDGSPPKRLSPADTAAEYLQPDWVVFVRETSLVARHLDPARGELTGDTVTLADPVGSDALLLKGAVSVSRNGRIAYRAASGGSQRQLTWFDRTGKSLGVVGEPDGNELEFPELSPDEHRIAVSRTIQNNPDVWLLDPARSSLMMRLTLGTSDDREPVWSPDGARIVFASHQKEGITNLYIKSSTGIGAEELLFESPNSKAPQDWSNDGRFLLYYEVTSKTGRDLWVLDMTAKERKPRVLANTPFDEREAQFSPDGRWVAYETNESGRFEIVVQPFPDLSGKWQVSTGGGVQPRWRPDGKELYFIAPDGKLMAVPVNGSGVVFGVGTAVALFPTRLPDGGGPSSRPQYAVSRDGRFLINTVVGDAPTPPIELILNWRGGPDGQGLAR